MGLDIKLRSRPLHAPRDLSAADVARAGAVGGTVGTVVSGLFHHYGPPKMAIGTPWAKATFGVGLMAALGAATLYATNHTGALHGGKRTNSVLGSTALNATAFAIPGIWIHGKMDFSGNPVNRWAAAAGVAVTGALVGPLIHQFTMPDD